MTVNEEQSSRLISSGSLDRSFELDSDLIEEISELGTIHASWENYALHLLNSTPDPLRSIWREKLITSIINWEFKEGSIGEGNLAGLEVLSALPDEFTKMVVDDVWDARIWAKRERLSGSKKMKIFLGHYPQESLSNEANLCCRFLIENYEEYGSLITETPILAKIWNFTQASGGRCVYPDEILTYTLEKPINDELEAPWVEVASDLYLNGIPSDKFEKYYFVEKIEGFPLSPPDDIEQQKQNFLDVCDVMFKEDMLQGPNWKRICISILKNDISFQYAGFTKTLKENQARERAMQAFDSVRKEVTSFIDEQDLL